VAGQVQQVPGLPSAAFGAELILADQFRRRGQPGRLQRGAVPGQPGPAGPQLVRPADDADAPVPELDQVPVAVRQPCQLVVPTDRMPGPGGESSLSCERIFFEKSIGWPPA
jgi:hypothetical protein